MNDPFGLPHWNTDQALIWIATRDAKRVEEACDPSTGLCWMLCELPNGDRDKAETALRSALYRRELLALVNRELVDNLWFGDAWITHPLGSCSFEASTAPHERDKFVLSDGTAISPAAPLASAWPRFDPMQMLRLFPQQGKSKVVALQIAEGSAHHWSQLPTYNPSARMIEALAALAEGKARAASQISDETHSVETWPDSAEMSALSEPGSAQEGVDRARETAPPNLSAREQDERLRTLIIDRVNRAERIRIKEFRSLALEVGVPRKAFRAVWNELAPPDWKKPGAPKKAERK